MVTHKQANKDVKEMQRINEEFLHFIWINQHLAGITLENETGHCVEVIHPGQHNHDAGPDFFDARIMINGTLWAGNVEIHINASDWIKHHHDQDAAYDSVILHVVYYPDCVIRTGGGRVIPVVTIRFPVILWETYTKMMKASSQIKCESLLRRPEQVQYARWTSSLMIEKLQLRYHSLDLRRKKTASHWESLLHQEICRCFGIPVNTIPFELLAQSVPFEAILRHKKSIHSLEALLFGQAGFLLSRVPADRYTEHLRELYLRQKPRIPADPVRPELWKYSRMRPASLPAIRIAQLAALIHHRYPLLGILKQKPTLSELISLFRVRAGDYWNTRYLPGKLSPDKMKFPGTDFIHRIIINGLVPFLFYYGASTGEQQIKAYSIELLEKIAPENNQIIKKWSTFEIRPANAFESQALLHLYKHYCTQDRCLECQFGNMIIVHGQKSL